MADGTIAFSGRQLTLPPGPIFQLTRAEDIDYELGAFRPWAGYKDFGSAEATDGLVLLQHVLSFGPTSVGGRTGVHAHLAHAHIVIPTSGKAHFSYDGVVTEAAPGSVIVQHGGTVHDQFQYSYAPASKEQNSKTPMSVEPSPADAPPASFGFLELFVPRTMAHVEIVPPQAVTEADERTAWRHPYHAWGAHYALQTADDPAAAYGPVPERPDLEARDCGAWDGTGRLVAAWIIRPASAPSAGGAPVSLTVPGETDGVALFYMVQGAARLSRTDGADAVTLRAGDTLTCSEGLVGLPEAMSPDMRLLRFFVTARAQALRERTPEEIARLQALGPGIITSKEVRPEGDTRPINFLVQGG